MSRVGISSFRKRLFLQLHRLTRGDGWDAGQYKEKDADIIEKFPDGRSRVRFKTVAAADTTICMKALVERFDEALKEREVPPLVLLAAFNLDFLCIHPFRDGNGRVSRLLLLLQCYHLELEIGRYIKPGASHRTEQGAILRSPGAKLPGLARGKTRPLAIHQLHSFHHQDGIP